MSVLKFMAPNSPIRAAERSAMNQYLANVVSNKLNFDYLELFIKEL